MPHPATQAVNRPEKKFGPYPGGVGVAIWVNSIQTDQGERKIRSVTIAPRRYRDPKSGKWRDAGSYRPSDLPALLFALAKAQEFCLTEPIPGDDANGDGHGEPPEVNPEDVPF
jgi:hypothetical protein